MKRKMTGEKESTVEADKRDWTSLPEDLLRLILSNLSIEDVYQFNAVCKTWQSVPDPKRRIGSQFLIEKRRDGSKFKLFHPLLRYPYFIDIPELRGASILFSKDGWLLMSIERCEIFFFNPFTKSKIRLPDLPKMFNQSDFKGVTFTSNPTSYDCMVFGICAILDQIVDILTISRGEGSWRVTGIFNETPTMYPSYCNPVFYEEKFYWLSKHGKLGVFDPSNYEWTIFQSRVGLTPDRLYESYLIDCDGDLMSVFIGTMGYFVSIYKWDESASTWQDVKDLGENMLFLSETTSFARKSVKDYMKNKIYFPRFHSNHIVFMSLENGLYNTFGNDFSRKDLNNTTYQLECSWIEPIKNEYFDGDWFDWFGSSISPEFEDDVFDW